MTLATVTQLENRQARRFDPRPLLVLSDARARTQRRPSSSTPDDWRHPPDETVSARLLGINRRTIRRWRTGRTLISLWEADRYAVRLGHHPLNIWPDFHGDTTNDLSH